jgi:putative N6-adenine-specific DNA methylase
MKLKLCAPCLFGLEGLVSDELKRLGMEAVEAENGRVYFAGGYEDMARANLWLRTAERVLITVGSFEATTFDQLFEGTRALEFEAFLPADAAFPVRGHCVDSRLMSVPDCCAIIKKAASDRLMDKYKKSRMPETGAKYQLRFTLLKNKISIYIDTTGPALHKRGYRAMSTEAPLRETLAAGMVMLSKYRGKDAFRDLFCGSGTIVIEAALIAMNRAPGLNRGFDFEKWESANNILPGLKEKAATKEFLREYDIWGSDIDPAAVSLARSNAEKAGVSDTVRFEVLDARRFVTESGRGRIVSNPPYGVRLSDNQSIIELCGELGRMASSLEEWSLYILSGDAEFEQSFGRKADKKRKLYNGMLKCDLYMYLRTQKGKL